MLRRIILCFVLVMSLAGCSINAKNKTQIDLPNLPDTKTVTDISLSYMGSAAIYHEANVSAINQVMKLLKDLVVHAQKLDMKAEPVSPDIDYIWLTINSSEGELNAYIYKKCNQCYLEQVDKIIYSINEDDYSALLKYTDPMYDAK